MNPMLELDVTDDVLTQLESQPTPLRIQGHRQSYYVLTVEQILALMQPPQNMEDDTTFAAQDFGLTEDDITAYLDRRHERQQQVGLAQQTPLPADLQNRLEMIRSLAAVTTTAPPVDEQTLQALEAAMLRSLQTTIQNMKH